MLHSRPESLGADCCALPQEGIHAPPEELEVPLEPDDEQPDEIDLSELVDPDELASQVPHSLPWSKRRGSLQAICIALAA